MSDVPSVKVKVKLALLEERELRASIRRAMGWELSVVKLALAALLWGRSGAETVIATMLYLEGSMDIARDVVPALWLRIQRLRGWFKSRRKNSAAPLAAIAFLLLPSPARAEQPDRPSAAVIHQVLEARTSWADRRLTGAEHDVALAPVAIAIAEAAHNRLEAAILIALARHESGLAVAVVYGHCPAGQCDGGRARGTWQLHASACRAAYAFAAGSVESIEAEARCAIAQMRHHAARCRAHASSPLNGAFAGYATGGGCHWIGADARVRSVSRAMAELERAEREAR